MKLVFLLAFRFSMTPPPCLLCHDSNHPLPFSIFVYFANFIPLIIGLENTNLSLLAHLELWHDTLSLLMPWLLLLLSTLFLALLLHAVFPSHHMSWKTNLMYICYLELWLHLGPSSPSPGYMQWLLCSLCLLLVTVLEINTLLFPLSTSTPAQLLLSSPPWL